MNDASDTGRRLLGGFPRRHKVVSAMLALSLALVAWSGVRLWQLRHSVGRHRAYWSVPRGDAGGLLYVALGDSTAQGIGASRPERGYVGLLAQRLRAATGRPVQVLNLSRSGARLHDVVAEQLPLLAGLSPDLVTVGIGANDLKHYDAARFRADVDALVAGLPPQTVVGDVPWFMHGGTGRKSGEAAAYVAARAGEANLAVARLHRAMRARGWRAMLTDFAADWFHPNDRGHRVWARAFWQEIEAAGLASAHRAGTKTATGRAAGAEGRSR